MMIWIRVMMMIRLMLMRMRMKMTMMIIDMGKKVLTSPTSYFENDKTLLSALWLPR